MKPADAAELLAIAAAFDRRTIGETDARAWALALKGLGPAECAQAIATHYGQSTDWIMPAHVRDQVRAARRVQADKDRTADVLGEIADARAAANRDRLEKVLSKALAGKTIA